MSNINLPEKIDCECGKTHIIPTRYMVYDNQVPEKLPGILSQFITSRKIALLADTRTYKVLGSELSHRLQQADWSVQEIIVPDPLSGYPVCDDITQEKIAAEMGDVDGILAVGSGVVNDLSKWTAYDKNIPYACVATAASMNGYTSANVASIVNGLKTIVYARAPVAVLAMPEIIENAPYEMTSAGLGDVLAKPVSTADWIMNNFLFDEYYCQRCTQMITDLEPKYFDNPEGIKERNGDAVGALYNALLYSGIAMTMAGTSAPASGGEHMLSHTLDMMSLVDGEEHDLHGRQVGLGTMFASALYQRMFQMEKVSCKLSPDAIDRKFWDKLADSVGEQYNQKLPDLKTMRDKLSDNDNWRELLNRVKDKVRSPKEIRDCLHRAGAAYRIEDIGCSKSRMRDAVMHMHEIRKRCTVVDLAWVVGILPNEADSLIEQVLE